MSIPSEQQNEHTHRHVPPFGRRLGGLIRNLPLFKRALDRVPLRARPTLYLETFYNLGSGAFISLFLLSAVVLKTVLDGNENHLALLAAMFGGSSLLSPLVSYLGRLVPMKWVVVFPNFLVAAFLMATAVPFFVDWQSGAGHSQSSLGMSAATWFTLMVGLAFVMRVFPRVGEMNMFRILYPPTHRGAAVGWIKAVAAVSGLGITLGGYWWFGFRRELYWLLYVLVGLLLVLSALCYLRIPVARRNVFAARQRLAPHHAFREGLKIFLTDRRFLWYQFGFFFAGSANHMAYVYVPEVLKEHVHAGDNTVRFLGAVLPALLITASAPVWGRYLDRVNPMIGRSTFNTLQCLSFGLFAYGGVSRQLWPMAAGATLHAINNGGGTINWLTGSLYFARPENISLYNAVHVGLTGLRGMISPIVGLFIYADVVRLGSYRLPGLNFGPHLFWVASALSIAGALIMFVQGRADPGPRETAVDQPVSRSEVAVTTLAGAPSSSK